MLRVVDELFPDALHDIGRDANDRVENDHGRLKAGLKSLRGLRTDRTAPNVICGHAFVQNLRHGHDELGGDASGERLRSAAAFGELAQAF